jgi:hypothetical protein
LLTTTYTPNRFTHRIDSFAEWGAEMQLLSQHSDVDVGDNRMAAVPAAVKKARALTLDVFNRKKGSFKLYEKANKFKGGLVLELIVKPVAITSAQAMTLATLQSSKESLDRIVVKWRKYGPQFMLVIVETEGQTMMSKVPVPLGEVSLFQRELPSSASHDQFAFLINLHFRLARCFLSFPFPCLC